MIELKKQVIAYTELMRLDKPIGTLLLLWPTWWALWLAGNLTPYILIVFSLGVLVMRSMGCVINDYADRHFDGQVTRTQYRPFPTGRVNERGAKILFVLLLSLAFLLVLLLNWMSFLIAFFALFLAIIYPFMKRYTHLPQVVLGLAYSMSIPMAYAATTETLPLTCWLLFIVNVCWNMSYDTEYAMVDRNDDLRIGIKSTAVLLGHYDRALVGALQLTMLICLICVGLLHALAFLYYLALGGVALFFLWQQKHLQYRIPEECFKAFLNNNYVGFLIWIGILAGLYL